LVRWGFPATAAWWAAALPLATFAASRPQETLAHLLAAAVYVVGAAVCHQRPERSFSLLGAQMPVCARCAGIYFGAALAALAAEIGASAKSAEKHKRRAGRATAIRMLSLALLPTAATIGYEWTTGDMTSNVVRAAAGFCLGACVAALIQREIQTEVN
jgi:uncharacterized membrane protein